MKIIRLSKSCLGDAEKIAVMAVLDHEFLGMGAEVKAFEQEIQAYLATDRQVMCVNTGTSALHLALQAAGIGSGDEVLVPSLTYVASYQAISATGGIPVSCDICEETLTLDPKDAKKRITSNTKAIMPVYYTGACANIDDIYNLAKEYDLRVIEDAAQAFGSIHNGKKVGTFGDIICFSFDGIKNITSGEGGAVVTGDKVIAQKIKDARLLGVKNDTEKRYEGSRSWDFDVSEQGWRYHMSNLMAAIGREQLKAFEPVALKRQHFAKLYDAYFNDQNNITSLANDYNNVVPHIYVVRLNNIEDRDVIREKMLAAGIQTGVHYQPNHLLTKFKSPTGAFPIPNAEAIHQEILTLPLHPDLSEDDIKYIADTLKGLL